jgi:hypothetical protein
MVNVSKVIQARRRWRVTAINRELSMHLQRGALRLEPGEAKNGERRRRSYRLIS